ncbi:hypothetical protein PR048_028085 [Dryococelus australis]|uniref:Uncharacterized protein n=1 Tax=Dryococelus australis TaxID=614101 RepID=A0ABQ9GIA8_9NEOP|nr:hypothetical protein PR048_028085 [Dryococelus australis]
MKDPPLPVHHFMYTTGGQQPTHVVIVTAPAHRNHSFCLDEITLVSPFLIAKCSIVTSISHPETTHLLHIGEPGSIHGSVAPGFSHEGIVPDHAAGRRIFSGMSRFPLPLHSGAAPYSPSFTLIGSQELMTPKSLQSSLLTCKTLSFPLDQSHDEEGDDGAQQVYLDDGMHAFVGRPRQVGVVPDGGDVPGAEVRAAVTLQQRHHAGVRGRQHRVVGQHCNEARHACRGYSRHTQSEKALQCPRNANPFYRRGRRQVSSPQNNVRRASEAECADESGASEGAFHDEPATRGGRYIGCVAVVNRATVTAVSLLTSHQGDPGSIPSLVTPDFRMWESCRTMPSVGGFSREAPVSPPTLSFPRCSILTSITLIGSQDLDRSECMLQFLLRLVKLGFWFSGHCGNSLDLAFSGTSTIILLSVNHRQLCRGLKAIRRDCLTDQFKAPTRTQCKILGMSWSSVCVPDPLDQQINLDYLLYYRNNENKSASYVTALVEEPTLKVRTEGGDGAAPDLREADEDIEDGEEAHERGLQGGSGSRHGACQQLQMGPSATPIRTAPGISVYDVPSSCAVMNGMYARKHTATVLLQPSHLRASHNYNTYTYSVSKRVKRSGRALDSKVSRADEGD